MIENCNSTYTEELEHKVKMAESFLHTIQFVEGFHGAVHAPAHVLVDNELLENQRGIQVLQRKKVCHFLYAMLFEITIKIIWEIEKEEQCRHTHCILNLYQELSHEKQSQIKYLYEGQVPIIREIVSQQRKVYRERNIPFSIPTFQSLREALKANRDVVINFKYDGVFGGKSSILGSIIWNDKRIYAIPPGYTMFPEKLLKYAKSLRDNPSC